MHERPKALLIAGSSRAGATTSESIANYIIERLSTKGVPSTKLILNQLFKSETGADEMLKLVDDADIVIFSFPLYVDTLPYLVTRAYELIHERKKVSSPRSSRFFVVINSGFPEPHQSDTAIGISRRFAKASGMTWAGAFAVGAGSAILGRPLQELKKKTKRLMEALDLASDALACGVPIPNDAFKLVSKGLPAWIYVMAANHVVKKEAAENRTLERMHDRPYLR